MKAKDAFSLITLKAFPIWKKFSKDIENKSCVSAKIHYSKDMKANTATNQGIYLGQGISPFPLRHAFARNKDGSNKRFLHSLEGVVEIPARELQEKMQAEMRGMESYYQAYPNTPLDWKKIEKKPWQPLRKQPLCNSLKTNDLQRWDPVGVLSV